MNEQADQDRRLVTLGHICAVHGVRGWVKIHSYTEPKEAVLKYQPWLLDDEASTVKVQASKIQPKGVIVKLDGFDSVEQARTMIGKTISIVREQLEVLPENEYYWADLIALRVVNLDGEELGQVKSLMATGANDVLVVAGAQERLIPFVMEQYIKTVDIPGGTITVDWDPDF